MNNQDFINEGLEDHCGPFGDVIVRRTFIPEMEVTEAPPQLWSGYEIPHPRYLCHGPDHLLPSELKGWQMDYAQELRQECLEYPETVWDDKLDWLLNEPYAQPHCEHCGSLSIAVDETGCCYEDDCSQRFRFKLNQSFRKVNS